MTKTIEASIVEQNQPEPVLNGSMLDQVYQVNSEDYFARSQGVSTGDADGDGDGG